MDNLLPYLLFMISVVLIELTLMVAALIHLFNHGSYRFGNRGLWFVLILLIQIIGPALYLTVGRRDE